MIQTKEARSVEAALAYESACGSLHFAPPVTHAQIARMQAETTGR